MSSPGLWFTQNTLRTSVGLLQKAVKTEANARYESLFIIIPRVGSESFSVSKSALNVTDSIVPNDCDVKN